MDIDKQIQALRFLLGDPQRGDDCTIAQWVERKEEEMSRTWDDFLTGRWNLFDFHFETGCAYMHVSRLREALDQLVRVRQTASMT